MGAGSSAAATIDVVPGGACKVRIVERKREAPATVDAASATADALQLRLSQIAEALANKDELQEKREKWIQLFDSIKRPDYKEAGCMGGEPRG